MTIPLLLFQLYQVDLFAALIAFPPAVTNIAGYSKRRKGKVENTAIHSFGRLLAKLLRSFSTDGALAASEL